MSGEKLSRRKLIGLAATGVAATGLAALGVIRLDKKMIPVNEETSEEPLPDYVEVVRTFSDLFQKAVAKLDQNTPLEAHAEEFRVAVDAYLTEFEKARNLHGLRPRPAELHKTALEFAIREIENMPTYDRRAVLILHMFLDDAKLDAAEQAVPPADRPIPQGDPYKPQDI